MKKAVKSKNPWKKLKSKVVYRNPYFSVREDDVVRPDGTRGKYYLRLSQDPVFILPVLDDGKIVMVRQWRYPTGTDCWEIPAGGSEGQNVLTAAKRELWEETGYTAKQWKLVGTFAPSNSTSPQWGHVYVARNLTQTGENKQQEDHIHDMRAFRLSEVLRMIQNGEIVDGPTIVAMLYWHVAQ